MCVFLRRESRVRLIVCDLDTSKMRWSMAELVCCAIEQKTVEENGPSLLSHEVCEIQ